jgi:hypothetical protein
MGFTIPLFGPMSAAPLSPAATKTVIPNIAAVCNSWSNCVWKLLPLGDSGPPQLMETIETLFCVS